MDTVVHVSEIAFKLVEDPTSIWEIASHLATIGGVISLLTVFFPKLFPGTTTTDPLAGFHDNEVILKRANALFEHEGGKPENSRVAMTVGIAIGFFWYSIFASCSPFNIAGIDLEHVALCISVGVYMAIVAYGVLVIVKSRCKAVDLLLLACGGILGVTASAFFVVLKRAHDIATEESIAAIGTTSLILIIVLLVPFFIKAMMQGRQQKIFYDNFMHIGLSSIESSHLAKVIVQMRPPIENHKTPYTKPTLVFISLALSFVGLFATNLAEPLYDSEGIYSVSEHTDSGELVESSYNLLGKPKKISVTSSDGTKATYYWTFRKNNNAIAYKKFVDGKFKSKASIDYDSPLKLIEELNSVEDQYGEGCAVFQLAPDGTGVVTASLCRDNEAGENDTNPLYSYSTYDDLKRRTSYLTLNDQGAPIDERLEYKYEGDSQSISSVLYYMVETEELKWTAVYERGETGNVRCIHWFDASGNKIDDAFYDDNFDFIGWESSMEEIEM